MWLRPPSLCGEVHLPTGGALQATWQEWAHTILPQWAANENNNTVHHTLSFG